MHSIASQKEDFIREQVRILSRRIQPERTTWVIEGGEEEIPEKVVEEAVKKVNNALRAHSRSAYSNEAVRHVAKQIASLYMREIREGEHREDDHDLSMMPLPEELEVDEKTRESYSSLYSRLQCLSAELEEEQARLGRYRQLEALLKPFERPGETVQPGLEMKGVVKESERMGRLLKRRRELVEGEREGGGGGDIL